MESVEVINTRLKDQFGSHDGQPHFRVVWSEDQFEKRVTQYTAEGLLLLEPEVRELPKYRQWIQNKYLLEKRCEIPEGSVTDLVTNISYEPVWVFQDELGNPLPPIWGAVKFVVETVLGNIQQAGNYTKYKDPATDPDFAMKEEVRLKELEDELWGNRTPLQEALTHGSAIIKP